MDSQKSAETKLEFQDFSNTDFSATEFDSDNKGQTINFTSFPDTALDDDDPESQLLADESSSGKTGTSSFWTFSYYQQFFDVDTVQVRQRLLWSMIPNPNKSYLQNYIRPNPDLYGPFWTCVTLIFCIAIAGNMANYLQMGTETYVWKYDFHKVSFAASVIFSYVIIVPLGVWAFLWWRKSAERTSASLTFLEIICVYGYSLTVYIPVSIFWLINLSWIRWTLAITGSVLSGSVLLMTFWPAVRADLNKFKFGVLAAILACHILLAVGFMEYFFYVPQMQSISVSKASVAPALLPKVTSPPELPANVPQKLKLKPKQDSKHTAVEGPAPAPVDDVVKNVEDSNKIQNKKEEKRETSEKSVEKGKIANFHSESLDSPKKTENRLVAKQKKPEVGNQANVNHILVNARKDSEKKQISTGEEDNKDNVDTSDNEQKDVVEEEENVTQTDEKDAAKVEDPQSQQDLPLGNQ